MKMPNFDIEVFFDEFIQDGANLRKTRFTDLPLSVCPIPADCIFYKTIPGLGATYSEIIAPRNSIIVLSNISIIISKHDDHALTHGTFPVHGDVTRQQVLAHLRENQGLKKFLTTPEALHKILWASKEAGIDPYKEFFILIDECHKIIRDANYREDMVPPMEEFFKFNNKAMISATPIPPSDPNFSNFKNIKATPSFNHKRDIKLIHSNGIVNAIQNICNHHQNLPLYIFFNSIQGIESIMEHLKISDESTLFCSQENENLLKENRSFSIKSIFNRDYTKKYNFFTSSFFNGLDIILEEKVPVLIVSDVGFADFSMVDPYSDVIQILGRIRNGYLDAYHINNCSRWTKPISQDEALNRIKISKDIFHFIETLNRSYTGQQDINFLSQYEQRCRPYYRLMSSGKLSYFKQDNYLYEKRIASYYANPTALKSAYLNTNMFNVEEYKVQFAKADIARLAFGIKKYSPENVKRITESLLLLESIKGTAEYFEYTEAICEQFPKVHDAYFELGAQLIQDEAYNIGKIDKALLLNDIITKKNSTALIELIYKQWILNRFYLSRSIKTPLQKIYDEVGLGKKAVATDLEYYFEPDHSFSKVKGKSGRGYIFRDYKFDILQKYRRR